MSEADNLDLPALAGAADIFRVHGAAVGGFDASNLGRSALGNGGHALGEDAIDADDGFVARFERVQDRGFDGARAGGGERKGHAILGLKGPAEEHLDVGHHRGEPGIEMAHQRSGQGAIDARVHGGRSGREH